MLEGFVSNFMINLRFEIINCLSFNFFYFFHFSRIVSQPHNIYRFVIIDFNIVGSERKASVSINTKETRLFINSKNVS